MVWMHLHMHQGKLCLILDIKRVGRMRHEKSEGLQAESCWMLWRALTSTCDDSRRRYKFLAAANRDVGVGDNESAHHLSLFLVSISANARTRDTNMVTSFTHLLSSFAFRFRAV